MISRGRGVRNAGQRLIESIQIQNRSAVAGEIDRGVSGDAVIVSNLHGAGPFVNSVIAAGVGIIVAGIDVRRVEQLAGRLGVR